MTRLETPHGPIKLRRVIPADGAALRAFRVEALRLHPSAFTSDLERIEAQTGALWSERIQKSNADETLATWIASHNETIVGTATITREHGVKIQHRGSLVAVYVNQAWRRFGISEGLIRELLAWAAQVGIETVELGVTSTNTAAIALYTRLGFYVYGVQQDFLRIDGTSYGLLWMARQVAER